jgi:hypothetical protein
MSNNGNHLPNGITVIDTESDMDTFSLALYSRIHDIVDHSESDTRSNEDSEDRSMLDSSLSQSDAHAIHGTLPNSNLHTDITPQSFMSRIQQQLQSCCQPSQPNQEIPTSSFLDVAEKKLEEYYDRVLSEDTEIDDSLCNDSMFVKLTKEEVFTGFKNKYNICLMASIHKPIQRLIDDTIVHYKQYFEAEKDIMNTAKRYDKLQTWLKHTRDVFDTQDVQLTVEQTKDMQAKIESYMNSSEEWTQKFKDAKLKWNQLCVSRQALNSIHQLVGGTSACKICFNKQVKTLLVPCGHVLCKECADRVTCCPFCNTSFYTRHEIYFM